jgi:protein-disulfide isomerase
MMTMHSLSTGLLFLLLLAGGSAAMADDALSAKALDKEKLSGFVRHLLMWGPQITVEVSDPKPSEMDGFNEVLVKGTAGAASQQQVFFVSEDGSQVVRAVVYNIEKNPFHKDFERISVAGQPSLGTTGAPVRIVLYTDFQCPFCQQEAKMLRENLIKNYPEQVKLYFKDFPLEAIHPWARAAAGGGRCFYSQSEGAFWNYHDWVFEHQNELTPENLTEKTLEFAGTQPDVDLLRLTSCINSKEKDGEVAASLTECRAMGINSTPTLFINGRRIAQHVTWANLKGIIDFELDYQKTAKNAGDIDCCAITLPTPLTQ